MNMKAQKSRATASAGDCQLTPATAVARKNSLKLATLLCQRADWTKSSIEEAIFEDIDGSQFGDAKIPNPSHCARITATNTAGEGICPHGELLHYFGDGLLCFPFTATFAAEITYSIASADYSRLSGERKRKAMLIRKGRSGGICTEGCKLHLKALAMIELAEKDQKVIGSQGVSPKELQSIVTITGMRVGVRTMRIVSFADRFLKKK